MLAIAKEKNKTLENFKLDNTSTKARVYKIAYPYEGAHSKSWKSLQAARKPFHRIWCWINIWNEMYLFVPTRVDRESWLLGKNITQVGT